MPSIKDLKKRIGTVKNTQQTTRAMKMVSAAKLRRAQDAIQNQRPYAKKVSALIRELAGAVEIKSEHPLKKMTRSESFDSSTGALRKVLLVLVTSDRGLCGGFNANIIKSSQKWIQSAASKNLHVELAFVGKKGHDFYKNRDAIIVEYFHDIGGKATFNKAKRLSDSLVGRFVKGEFDEIKFIYNEFKNAVLQKVVIEDFLPLRPLQEQSQNIKENVSLPPTVDEAGREYIVKPSAEAVFVELIEKNFIIQAFRILLESQAGEHGARMSSMENATKNAGEMIRKLTLQFNKQRQASITKELLEIIAGSESQKG